MRVACISVDGVNGDGTGDLDAVQSFVSKEKLSFPVLLATPDVAGVYNIIYRYLFDRRRDLALPTSFLIDPNGMIVKVYQRIVNAERLGTLAREDLKSVPSTRADRLRKALPFAGTLYDETFQRNDFTYGVAFFQHGYLDQAEASFKQVIATKPDDPEAHYNLGTLYLRRNALPMHANTLNVRLRYVRIIRKRGTIWECLTPSRSANEAAGNFLESLRLRPDYAIALANLGNLYRRQGNLEEAEKSLSRALELEPDNPEINYNLGMLYVREEQFDRAKQSLERAVTLRPDYPDALNNLAVIFVREKNYPAAEERFQTCIRVAPNFDQAYLNLARLYAIQNDKEKAREILQALLRLQPQHKVAQQTLEMLN